MLSLMRPPAASLALAERMSRPQRIGIFGNRGVGKTTLLAMIYREAVAGRLPGLRLAAADTRTAEYLSDKVLQLEAGQALPGTLAETELRFQLYHGETRLELLLKDYQGEHIELGRREAIHDFLRDCDAVWLCLDLETLPSPAERLRRQQEIEQLIEDYLAGEARRKMDRPIALVLTKADLLGPLPGDAGELAASYFGMTRHTLESHCKNGGMFAVSSLGDQPAASGQLQPRGLADPLAWLATALQEQDEARLEQLWALAGHHTAILERAVACFARRYADAPVTQAYRQRLRELRQRRRRSRSMIAAAVLACFLGSLWTYDALGYRDAVRFQSDHSAEPAASLQHWQTYKAWHPTRHLFAATAEEENQRLHELANLTREQQRDKRLTDLRRRVVDPDADPEALWQQFQDFRGAFPELDIAGDLERVHAAVKARRDEEVNRRARRAYDDLARAGQRSTDLTGFVVLADRLIREYPGSPVEPEARKLRTAALLRLDEQDIQAAREYSVRQPLHFHTRREMYQGYLDRHPGGGAFAEEAKTAIRTIDDAWDRHDFRRLRDQFVTNPADTAELVNQCRRYLAVHPSGKFTASATELLRWTERVTATGEYRVVLRSGQVEDSIARWISRGPKLSVELEVAGIRYGPSSIVKNRYDPEWNFEFPRRVRWKLGDPVVIRVTEHTWKDRLVLVYSSTENERLAIRMLCGDNYLGPNRVTFESDFAMPKLPKVE
jgi:hypothetical protein